MTDTTTTVPVAKTPTKYERFWNRFKNSEVVLWSRIQVLLGGLSTVGLVVWYQAAQTDISPFFKDPRIVTGFIFVNGLITELLRRRGTITHDGRLIDAEVYRKVRQEGEDAGAGMSPGDVQGN